MDVQRRCRNHIVYMLSLSVSSLDRYVFVMFLWNKFKVLGSDTLSVNFFLFFDQSASTSVLHWRDFIIDQFVYYHTLVWKGEAYSDQQISTSNYDVSVWSQKPSISSHYEKCISLWKVHVINHLMIIHQWQVWQIPNMRQNQFKYSPFSWYGTIWWKILSNNESTLFRV